jgi:small subunit ribosomal protein S27e
MAKYLKLLCSKCKNKQTVFEKPSSKVKCLVCGITIVEPTGGKGNIKTKILEVLE